MTSRVKSSSATLNIQRQLIEVLVLHAAGVNLADGIDKKDAGANTRFSPGMQTPEHGPALCPTCLLHLDLNPVSSRLNVVHPNITLYYQATCTHEPLNELMYMGSQLLCTHVWMVTLNVDGIRRGRVQRVQGREWCNHPGAARQVISLCTATDSGQNNIAATRLV